MSAITHEARFRGLEARTTTAAENITALNDTVYKMNRRTVRTELGVQKILGHLGLQESTDEEVDDFLDAE